MITEPGWVLVKQNISSYFNYYHHVILIICYLRSTYHYYCHICQYPCEKIIKPIIALRMPWTSNGDLTVQTNIRSKNELGIIRILKNATYNQTNYEDLASMHEELLANEEQLRAAMTT